MHAYNNAGPYLNLNMVGLHKKLTRGLITKMYNCGAIVKEQ